MIVILYLYTNRLGGFEMGENNKQPVNDNNTQTKEGLEAGTKQPANNEETPQPQNTPQPPVNKKENITELLETVDSAELLKSAKIQELLQNARVQEKDKLYKTIELKDNTIKQLEKEIEKLKEEVKLKEEQGMADNQELLETIKQMKEAQDKLVEDLEAEKKARRQAELDSYKQKKIQEANGEILVELVTGETEEEIDESVELAKQKYQEIINPYREKLEEYEEKLSKPNPQNAPKPADPTPSAHVEFTAEEIKKMTPEEYKKYREQILKMTKN